MSGFEGRQLLFEGAQLVLERIDLDTTQQTSEPKPLYSRSSSAHLLERHIGGFRVTHGSTDAESLIRGEPCLKRLLYLASPLRSRRCFVGSIIALIYPIVFPSWLFLLSMPDSPPPPRPCPCRPRSCPAKKGDGLCMGIRDKQTSEIKMFVVADGQAGVSGGPEVRVRSGEKEGSLWPEPALVCCKQLTPVPV
jgi:hypothetical protein